jgi:hypothetical protein
MDVRTQSPNNTVPDNEFVGSADLPGAEDDNPIVTLSADGDPESNEIVESDSPHAASEDQVNEETEARASGWVSREEWISSHGNEKGWKPAADYNDFRKNFLPIVQRENRELRQKLDALTKTIGQEQSEKQQAKQRLERESLKLELRQAREDGDWDKVEELSDKMFDLRVAQVAPQQVPQEQQVDPEVRSQFEDFAAQNQWLKTDKDLATDFAVNLKQIIDARIPGMSMDDCMQRARRTTIAMNQDKFNRRTRPAMADSGGSPGVSRGTGMQKSWNDLRPEVKRELESMIADNPGLTRAGVLKNCDPSHFRN